MALTRQDKDNQSFTEVNGQQARRVTSVGIGNLLEGVIYDYVKATYPTTSSETYTYRNSGSSGTVTAVISVTYTDDTKEVLDSVERTT